MKKIKILSAMVFLASLFFTNLLLIFPSPVQAACLNPVWTQNNCPSGKTAGDLDECSGITPPWGQGTPNDTCCCTKSSASQQTPAAIDKNPVQFTPQVAIPGSSLQGTTAIGGDSIGKYVISIYNYGLSIVGILAALILMAGGVLWLTSAGNTAKIVQAKELMTGSIIGILILVGAWMLLNTINPNLTKFKALEGIDIINELLVGSCCEYSNHTAKNRIPQIDCESSQGTFYKNGEAMISDDGQGHCADTGCCRCKLGGSWKTVWFSNSTCIDEKNGGGKVLPVMCEIACEAAGDASHVPAENQFIWDQSCDKNGECS